MSDACILCDTNVPRAVPHFVVIRDVITEGVMCGDAQACLQRAVIRSMKHETFRSEHQVALKDAVHRFVSFGEMLPA